MLKTSSCIGAFDRFEHNGVPDRKIVVSMESSTEYPGVLIGGLELDCPSVAPCTDHEEPRATMRHNTRIS